MDELLKLVLGAGALIGGAFLFQAFNKGSADRNQVKLEADVKEINRKTEAVKAEIAENDKKTQEKVDAITEEQKENLSTKSLADWFTNRK